MSDRVGQQLGNYRLTHLLGQGGFADVYLGEHAYLKTPAAIKVLQTRVTNDDLTSFIQEAQNIARLVHPHIIRIFDFGIDGNTPFLVMDYAPQGTLRQRYPKGTRLSLATLALYVKQVADALQYAHDEKLIHRDIKPENILLGRRDEVLLSDFGIALAAQSSRYQSTQDIVGTVAYMSPEQIQGKPRTASDQYALAIVAYEWICGTRPFHGSFTELCAQHIFAAPSPLRDIVPTISPAIDQVISIALAKDPKQRFASVQAFAMALEQACQGEVIPTVSSAPKDKSSVYTLSSSDAPLQTPSQPFARSEPRTPLIIKPGGKVAPSIAPLAVEKLALLSNLTGHRGTVMSIAISRDGQTLVSGSQDRTIKVWKLPTGEAVRTLNGHRETIESVAISADGQTLVSGSWDNTIKVWNLSTGEVVHTLTNHRGAVKCVVISRDGQMLVSGSQDKTIKVWNLSTGREVRTLTAHTNSVTSVAISADRQTLVSASFDRTIKVWNLFTGKEVRTLNGHTGAVESVALSADGQTLVSGSKDKTIKVWKLATGQIVRTLTGHTDWVNSVVISADGQILVSGSGDRTIRVWDLSADQVGIFTDHSDAVCGVAISADGQTLVSGSQDKTIKVWGEHEEF
jgi:eukaryotic-like serine/threonine-protein kinase